MAMSNMAWEGVKFFLNQECVNILGCSVTFYEYKNVFLMLVDLSLHNSGLICNQATALFRSNPAMEAACCKQNCVGIFQH